jgi:hypothetical protein
VVVVVLGEHEFGVLEDGLGVGLVVGAEPALAGDARHGLEGVLDLGLELRAFGGLLGLLEDGLDGGDVVFVEVEGEEGVGGGEVVARRLERPVLADYLHPL